MEPPSPPPSTPASPRSAQSPDDEASLIDALLAARLPSARTTPRLDAGDDAAITADGVVVTVDALVHGVHWDDRLDAADVGYKAVAVSVSDLAAMGARPGWAVLALALPHADGPFVAGLARGLAEACARWDLSLVGGDTVRTSGPAVVSLTMGGRCEHAPLTRAAARPGDDLWVTGTLGLAGAGWRRRDPPAAALTALRRPDPPLAFALALAAHGLAHAAMDLSDGLATDLPRLCAASGVAATVDPTLLPADACLGDDPLADQVAGGEDYQLLFTAPVPHRASLAALARDHGVRLTRIGTVHVGHGATLSDRPWPAPAFRHFDGEARP
ncbi:MAG: thiamine-phosphate kinase [Alphaproteobacteria bacterium]|nr:thiamine-phosphate kinase [Alphaproteobacteria bacterium]